AQLAHRLLPPVGDDLLELGVAQDRDTRQTRERVQHVCGVTASLALGRVLELPDERPGGGHARVALQARYEVSKRPEPNRRVPALVAEADDQGHLRALVCVAERVVPNPAAVGGDAV